ncbi:hypothetical protein GJR96_09325 [Haloferax sp. MBLA0076]|uniref:Uncharacterized protein n=1 Tax=Haloferax litoreum TaxID=2666140 RepID=A0A6A8GFK2_9EURY|nr:MULTISPECIES: hypothetical protein [Haloferax]KAB1193629.1 hypothetical protein Hfx1148_09305 [Haloferax sp. CBA1148]MRX22154.1 hypothetical protein [Haloferax litoreum]
MDLTQIPWSHITGFVVTASATLLGVWTAFWLDRQEGKRRELSNAEMQLQAIQKECSINNQIASSTLSTIQELQHGKKRKTNADHYVIDQYQTDAWDGSNNEQLVAVVDDELFARLQELYADVKSVNELVYRLRSESLHPEIGELVGEGGYQYEAWTISVLAYDERSEEVDSIGLGPLIRQRTENIIGEVVRLESELGEEIEDIRKRRNKLGLPITLG